MPSLKNRFTQQVTNYDQRLSKLEVSEVDQAFWHKTNGDKNRTLLNIVARDRREKTHPADEDDPYPYLRRRVPSILQESYTGKHQGHPKVIRRGNALKAIFYKNEKPLILGPVESKFEPPVCRPDPYTERTKMCQYRPLRGCQDDELDFIKPYPEPKKPTCSNWQHGPCKGDKSDDEKEPCIGRDWWFVWDYCQEGDKEPSCENCTKIDYPKRCKNTWMKAYSDNTMSCEAPNRRWELHQKCGSYLRFDSETGKSKEYSEGKGHIRLGNAVCESDKRGHINFQGSENAEAGTIDGHSAHEEVPIPNESDGARWVVVAPTDNAYQDGYGTISADLMDLPTTSGIRIYKDGTVRVRSHDNKAEVFLKNNGHCWLWNIPTDAYIEMPTDGTVVVHSDVKIILDSDVDITGNLHNFKDVQTDGTCTHKGCVCPCCS